MNHNDELLSKVANDLKTKNLGAVIRKTRKYIHKEYLNFLIYGLSNFLSQKFDRVLFPHVGS